MVDRFEGSRETLFVFDDVVAEAEQHSRKPAAKDAEKVTGARLERMRQAQNGKCYYSGKTLTQANVSLDHKQPLAKGGKHVMSNVALCTKAVNRMKGQMTELEFIELCRKIAMH